MFQDNRRNEMKDDIRKKYSKLFDDLADERKDSIGTIYFSMDLLLNNLRNETANTAERFTYPMAPGLEMSGCNLEDHIRI